MEGLSRGKKLWEKSFERTVMKKCEMSITARVRRDGLVLCQNKQFHRLDSLPPHSFVSCVHVTYFSWAAAWGSARFCPSLLDSG